MSYIYALIILCICIFIHELGHFIAAKLSKINVLEFALGFGPKLLSFSKGGTTYALRLIPLGGMCSMQGEDDDDLSEGSFQNAHLWKRIIVVAAGPFFNFLLAFFAALVVISGIGADPCTVAFVDEGSPAAQAGLKEGDLIVSFEGSSVVNSRELYLYTYLDGMPQDEINLEVIRNSTKISLAFAPEETDKYLLGFSYTSDGGPALITEISSGMPMDKAGFKAGDIITGINGSPITSNIELSDYFSENPMDGTPVAIEYEREGVTYTTETTPELTVSKSGGFSYSTARVKQGLLSTVEYSFKEIKYWINATLKSLASLIKGRFGIQELSGPVGVVSTIGEVYNEAAAEGVFIAFMSMVNMVILLSANLGIMNLLPFPALDGGRLVFLIIEIFTRKRCDQRIEGAIHFAGIIFLFGLAAVVAFNDILKLL